MAVQEDSALRALPTSRSPHCRPESSRPRRQTLAARMISSAGRAADAGCPGAPRGGRPRRRSTRGGETSGARRRAARRLAVGRKAPIPTAAGRRVGQHGDVPGRARGTLAARLRLGDLHPDCGGCHARLGDQGLRVELHEEEVQRPRGRMAGALARRGLARVHGRRDSASQPGARPTVRAGHIGHGRTGSGQQQDERAMYEGRVQGHRRTVCLHAVAQKSAPVAVRGGPRTSPKSGSCPPSTGRTRSRASV